MTGALTAPPAAGEATLSLADFVTEDALVVIVVADDGVTGGTWLVAGDEELTVGGDGGTSFFVMLPVPELVTGLIGFMGLRMETGFGEDVDDGCESGAAVAEVVGFV